MEEIFESRSLLLAYFSELLKRFQLRNVGLVWTEAPTTSGQVYAYSEFPGRGKWSPRTLSSCATYTPRSLTLPLHTLPRLSSLSWPSPHPCHIPAVSLVEVVIWKTTHSSFQITFIAVDFKIIWIIIVGCEWNHDCVKLHDRFSPTRISLVWFLNIARENFAIV